MSSICGPTKGVFVSVKNQMDYDVIRQAMSGEITQMQAAVKLGKSYRQTKRLIKKVSELGIAGLLHGNRGSIAHNRCSDELKQEVLKLLRERYFDFNLTHFREKLETEHGIQVKRESLRKWAHEEKLVKRAHHQKRKPKIHRTRHRMPRIGMMIQMDGSSHRWVGKDNPECCLIGAIDDATGTCLYAEFFPAEDTLSVLTVLMKIVENFGVPEVLYVDQAAHFGKANTRSRFVNWKEHLTHVEHAMAELGCRVLFAPTPQAKGRIERMWNTFQDRLIPELRIRHIGRIPTANYFLHNHFIPEFNQRFATIPSDPNSSYQPIPQRFVGALDDVFCIREWRKVTPGETLSWDGKMYSVHHDYRYSIRGLQIELRTRLDGSWQAFHAHRPVELRLFESPLKKSAA